MTGDCAGERTRPGERERERRMLGERERRRLGERERLGLGECSMFTKPASTYLVTTHTEKIICVPVDGKDFLGSATEKSQVKKKKKKKFFFF